MRRWILIPASRARSACSLLQAQPEPEVYRDVAYVSDGHPRQVADLYVPQEPGPHAAVMVVHGGGWSDGEPEDMQKYVERLVDAGYVVMNVSYRLAPEFHFPAQTNDLAAAHRWLIEHADDYQVDPQRIAALGYSAGAHLVLMRGLWPQGVEPRLAAVVAGAGPTDMSVYYDSPYLLKLIGGTGHEYPEKYAKASPVQHVSPDDPPVFLYHGTWDRLVEFEQSEKLAAELRAAGVQHELVAMPFKGHITGFLFDGRAYEKIEDFLARHLHAGGAQMSAKQAN